MRKMLQSGRQSHFGAKRPSGGVAPGGIRKDDSTILTGGSEVPDVPEFCVRNLRLLQVKKNASYSTHITYHIISRCTLLFSISDGKNLVNPTNHQDWVHEAH